MAGKGRGAAKAAPRKDSPRKPRKPPSPPKLTEQQRVFIVEYVICNNGAEAARRAGYKAKNANKMAHELLQRPHIQAAIAERRAAVAERHELTQAEIIKGLRAEAQHIGLGSSHSARVQAYMGLAKIGGYLSDRVDVEHSGEVKLNATVTFIPARPQPEDEEAAA